MAKFKVGDVVIGNKLADKYGITDTGWCGVVTSIDEPNDMIWVKPYGNAEVGDRYHVEPECFDLYQTPVLDPIEMTKQELLDILSAQNDCFYSLAQVVEMINKIEDPKPVTSKEIKITEQQFDNFVDEVVERFQEEVRRGTDFVDLDSAEFSLNGNEIELDSVDLHTDDLYELVQSCVCHTLNNHVTIEKSEALEA